MQNDTNTLGSFPGAQMPCRVVSALAGSPQHTLPWGRSQARRGSNVTGDAYRLFLPVLQVAVLVLLSILSIIDIFIYCTEIFSSLTFQLSPALLACIAGYSNLGDSHLGEKKLKQNEFINRDVYLRIISQRHVISWWCPSELLERFLDASYHITTHMRCVLLKSVTVHR